MTRSRLVTSVVIAIVTVALGWTLMTTLSRVLRQSDPIVSEDVPEQQTTPADTPAVPRINAKLFFASEDCTFTTGHMLSVDGGFMATGVMEG